MNSLKKAIFIVCFFNLLGLWSLSLSGVAIANQNEQEASLEKCIKSCEDSKQVCWNMDPDRRLCEAQFQLCMENCNKKYSAPVVEDVKPPEPKTTQTLH